MESKTTEIFYLVDEFCKKFYKGRKLQILRKSTINKNQKLKILKSRN